MAGPLTRRWRLPAPPGATDHLTGLGSRRDLLASGAQMLVRARAAADGHVVAVLVVDLDRLKAVNDALGHRTGDRVLAEAARRLRGELVPGATTARLGGDEFAALQPCASPGDAVALRDRVDVALREPFVVDGVLVPWGASVGVATSGADGERVEDLLAAADQEMYAAKRGLRVARPSPLAGRATAGAAPAPDSLDLVADLRRALDEPARGELRVHYQPQVTPAGEVAAHEALLRWEHPVLGPLAPAGLVALAERHGLAARLDGFVLAQALADRPVLHAGAPTAGLAVNLSAHTLLGSDLPGLLRPLLEATGVPGGRLTLEVSESATTLGRGGGAPGARVERAAYDALAELGCHLSVQEFGAARASLTALWHPLVGEVKVHPELTAGLLRDPEVERMVRGVVQAAHGLGVRVVAEGVESAAVAARAGELGCDAWQGFWVAAPMALLDAVDWMAFWRRQRACANAAPVVETTLQS